MTYQVIVNKIETAALTGAPQEVTELYRQSVPELDLAAIIAAANRKPRKPRAPRAAVVKP